MPAEMTFTLLPSLDVADYLKRSPRRYLHADMARFVITTPCVSGCQLVVLGDGKELGRLPLDVAGRHLVNEKVAMQTDVLTVVRQGSERGFWASKKVEILEAIRDAFEFLTPKLLLVAAAAYAAGIMAMARRRQLSPMLLYSTALIGALFGNLAVVSYVDATSFQAVVTHYLSCAYVVLPLAVMFALWEGAALLQGRLGNTLARMRGLPVNTPSSLTTDLASSARDVKSDEDLARRLRGEATSAGDR
jgi:hypothetical protein